MGGVMLGEPIARYFPVDVPFGMKPGYVPLGKDLGNGLLDAQVFQFDGLFSQYREAKEDAHAHADLHVAQTPDAGEIAALAAEAIIAELAKSGFFRWKNDGFSRELYCRLTAETLRFDKDLRLIEHDSVVPYKNALDALACQVQEDVAVMRIDDERDWLAYAHVMFPSHWDPREKMGKSFAAMHRPVPKMGAMSTDRAGQRMMEARTRRDPVVRFVYALTADAVLDHHSACHHREDGEGLYLRVERQVTLPLGDSFLFTIRTHLYDCAQLMKEELLRLQASVESMDDLTRAYKGVTAKARQNLDALIRR